VAHGHVPKQSTIGQRPIATTAKFFPRRRLINSAATLAVLGAVWLWVRHLDATLQRSSYFTGWLLLASLVFLALFRIRKMMPAPPLGSAAVWMQAHIYVGLATAGLFLMHVPQWRTGGWLESSLAALYAATFVSGLIGLYWTRTLPRRLSRVANEVLYERIPALRGGLREQAQTAVLVAVRTAGGATLGDFYNARLHDYFSTRRGWRYRLAPTSGLRKSLLSELTEATRYLSDPERKTAEQLFALVRRRDDLDYHEALQWRLRVWLFVHIGLTYPLLVVAGVHAWFAHAYYGGTP
jgi:hypothetical protein